MQPSTVQRFLFRLNSFAAIHGRFFSLQKKSPIKNIPQDSSLGASSQPTSRSQRFKTLQPSASVVNRLIDLGIEQRKRSFEQKKLLRSRTTEEKILPGKLRFVKSALSPEDFPRHSLPEVAFIGRSNVGKSSLINIVANTTSAVVSSRPGQTRSIDFYRLEEWFCLVDMPGFGFAYAPEELIKRWPELIFSYLKSRRNLRRLFVLVDARHGLKVIDRQLAEKLEENDVFYQVVLTKCDLLNPDELARRIEDVQTDLEAFRFASKDILLSSTKISSLKSDLRKAFMRLSLIPNSVLEMQKENSRAKTHQKTAEAARINRPTSKSGGLQAHDRNTKAAAQKNLTAVFKRPRK